MVGVLHEKACFKFYTFGSMNIITKFIFLYILFIPMYAYANHVIAAVAVSSTSTDEATPTDAQITAEIEKQIAAVSDLSFFNIKVETIDGVVFLQGVFKN